VPDFTIEECGDHLADKPPSNAKIDKDAGRGGAQSDLAALHRRQYQLLADREEHAPPTPFQIKGHRAPRVGSMLDERAGGASAMPPIPTRK
jgi:hypothetical protein